MVLGSLLWGRNHRTSPFLVALSNHGRDQTGRATVKHIGNVSFTPRLTVGLERWVTYVRPINDFCVCRCTHHCMYVEVRGHLAEISSLLPLWILGIKLRLSGLAASTFACSASPSSPQQRLFLNEAKLRAAGGEVCYMLTTVLAHSKCSINVICLRELHVPTLHWFSVHH